MNVLEKILEEIERRLNMVESIPVNEDDDFLDGEECYEDGRTQGRFEELLWCREIIHSHMDEFPKCSDCSRRKWYQKGYEDGKNNDGWIPVEERLPEVPEENPIFDNKPLELYLVDIGAEYPIRAFWNGREFTDGWSLLNVIAWQPLPERHKGDSNA